MQKQPTKVSGEAGTPQVGKVPVKVARRVRWAWAEASIWTDRMLATLEYGVQGEVWSSTMAKRLLCQDGPVHAETSPLAGQPIREDGPLTGKPDAGDPPVRFGGRGGRVQPAFPTPIERWDLSGTF